MVRRYFPQAPRSRLAAWSGRIGLFSLLVAALSVLIVRSALLDIGPALATFAAALGLATIAILLALMSFVTIWRQGLTGLGSSVLGIFLGSLLLAYPAYLGARAYRLPMINDITTDTANPPRFEALARYRPPGTSNYPGPAVAERQHAAYPDIVSLEAPFPPKLAFDVTLALIKKRRWAVVDARPPQEDRRNGEIEATARTPIMGFRDDVVVRITNVSGGSRIDVRSASRFGASDLGSNAARIRSLLEDIDDGLASAPEPKPEPDKKPQPGVKRPAPKR